MKRLPRLSSNALKLIALLSMTVDHIGLLLFPRLRIARILGRIAFPIFAYMIAEGCRHTSRRARYLGTVFLLGAAMQVLFWYTRHSLYQHVLITFSLSIALIFSIQAAIDRGGPWIAAAAAAVLGVGTVCLVLPVLLPLGFAVDYGPCGVALPLLIYAGRNRRERLAAAALGLAAVSFTMSPIQWWSLLSLPLLGLYDGRRGARRMKYLFYIYYPLHLIILEGIRLLRR